MKKKMSRHKKAKFKATSNLLLSSIFVITSLALSSEFLIPVSKSDSEESSMQLATSNAFKNLNEMTGKAVKVGFSSSMPKSSLDGLNEYFKDLSVSNDLVFFEVYNSDISTGFNYSEEIESLRNETGNDIKYVKKKINNGYILAVYDASTLNVSLNTENTSLPSEGIRYGVCGKNKCTDLVYLHGRAMGKKNNELFAELSHKGLNHPIVMGEFASPAISQNMHDLEVKGFTPLFKSISSDYRLGQLGSDYRVNDTLKKYTVWKEEVEHADRRGRADFGSASRMKFRVLNTKKALWASSMTKNILVPSCGGDVKKACIKDVTGSEVIGKKYIFSNQSHFPIIMNIKL